MKTTGISRDGAIGGAAQGAKAAIVDFDGTLFFTDTGTMGAMEEVFGKRISKSELWERFPPELCNYVYKLAATKYGHEPNARMISEVRSLGRDHEIIILTGRSRVVEQVTGNVLRSHGIEFDELITNPDVKVRDYDFKLGRLAELSQRYGSIKIYDDKQSNIDYFKQNLRHSDCEYYHVSMAGLLRV